MKRSFKVTVDAPTTVSRDELQDYIKDAVAHWGGQFHPEEPLFHLTSKDVQVRPQNKPKIEPKEAK